MSLHKLTWPSTPLIDDISALQRAFLEHSGDPEALRQFFPVEEAMKIVSKASSLFQQEPTVLDIKAEKSIVVFGDIHGQLHDLVAAFCLVGGIPANNIYVFNGDIVDRGAWGLECLLLLCAYKIIYPESVFIIRGNHECTDCARYYGFECETRSKYPDSKGVALIKEIYRLFSSFPMAAVIGKKVYVVHAGLHRRQFGRGRKLMLGRLCDLPSESTARMKPSHTHNHFEEMLWGDPTNELGLSKNTVRGCGLVFGPDQTEMFLKEHDFQLMIRGHEGPDARVKRPHMQSMKNGYTWDHVTPAGRLLTVFSAPDYPQFQSSTNRFNNKGAIVVLKPENLADPEIICYDAQPRPKVRAYYDYDTAVDSDSEMPTESAAAVM